MSTSNGRKPSTRQRPGKPGARRVSVLTAMIVLVVGILAAVVVLRGGELAGMGSPLPFSAVLGAHPAATAIAATSGS
jgi:hypothetical protein